MVEVIDATRRERLKWIKQQLDRVDRSAARDLYDWGVLFREVERDELWREDDAPNFYEWVEEHTPYSYRHANRAIDVAKHFTVEMCERWGAAKLAAGIRYAELTKKEELPGDLTALSVRYRDANGRYKSVPFVSADPNVINAACAQLEQEQKARRANERNEQLDPSLRARAVRLQDELPAAPRGTSRGDRVVVQKGSDGQPAFTFKAIPASELASFIELLQKHLLR